MNAKQENRFSMARAVLQTLNDNNTVVTTLPALATAKSQLTTLVSEIDTLSQVQGQKTTAQVKSGAAKAAIEIGLEVIAAAKAYALDANKPAISASFNYGKTELMRMRDTVLQNTLQLVKDNAALLATDLAAYGADTAKLADLQTAIEDFAAVITQPKTNIAARSTATKGIDAAFKRLADLVEKMDNMIETKRRTHTDFYNTYQSVRKVVDKKGKAKDKVDGGETPTPPQN